jgi:hypothetical protein
LLSVKLLGAVGDGIADDAPAARAAFNLTLTCGGCVFFPPGTYRFNSTVAIWGCVRGSRGFGAGVDGSTQPEVAIRGPGPGLGPAMVANHSAGNMLLQDLSIMGSDTGLLIYQTYKVRMINVGISADANADRTDTSAVGCNRTGCNVVLGSRNAALVIENSFWLWFERCSFAVANMYPCKDRHTDCQMGQRPAVILRGQPGGPVGTVYLVRFITVIFTGGGVQYQQTVEDPGGAAAGWMTFESCSQEDSATALLDYQSAPGLTTIPGLLQITITDYMNADNLTPHFGRGPAPVVSINCSAPACKINGLSISMAGLFDGGGPAVRCYAGSVAGTELIGADSHVYQAGFVMDADGLPVGSWKASTGAGWRMVGSRPECPGARGCSKNCEGISKSKCAAEIALSFAVEGGGGEPGLEIRSDGVIAWTAPSAPTDTVATSGTRRPVPPPPPPTVYSAVLQRMIAESASWDPPPLAPQEAVSLLVPMAGVVGGDVAVASHSEAAQGAWLVMLSANTKANSTQVVLRNVGKAAADLPAGIVKVLVTQLQL